MKRTIGVFLGDANRRVGTLRFNMQGTRQSAGFEYAPRVAFSILITNVDDHLHNHGFMHVAHGQWRLTPAFDINPFPERVRELKTWISEDTGPEASIDALMSVAPYFRLDRTTATQIITKVDDAVSRWRTIGAELGMSAHELDQFSDAFEHRERASARLITQKNSG